MRQIGYAIIHVIVARYVTDSAVLSHDRDDNSALVLIKFAGAARMMLIVTNRIAVIMLLYAMYDVLFTCITLPTIHTLYAPSQRVIVPADRAKEID